MTESATEDVFAGGSTDLLDPDNYDSIHHPVPSPSSPAPAASTPASAASTTPDEDDYGDRMETFQTSDTSITVNTMEGRVDLDEAPGD